MYLDKEGIEHQKTVPYNPESNGKVERGNRVILERTRTLIYESGLPLKFWAEAAAYMTHTANLTPRKNKIKTPYELYYGKVPNVSYLRTFGCTAYYHIPKNMRAKLDPTGRKAIMIGYSRERVGYRLFDIEHKVIVENRNVAFDETQKGSYHLGNAIDKRCKDWNIEDFISLLNDKDPNANENTENEINSNEQQNNEDNDEVESDEDDNNIENTVEHIDNQEINEDKNQDRQVSKRGRPKGLTMVETRRRKEESLRERENQLREEGVRRSSRLDKYYAHLAGNISVPRNFNEAHNDKNWDKWKEAMEKELESLNKYEVWYLCERPKNAKIIKSKWIFTNKRDGSTLKYKARLVAAGYNLIKDQDFDESYSPVISIDA